MSAWRGCVRWAFVPFTPAAPFRVHAGSGLPPVMEPDATDWARRIYEQGGAGDHVFLVSGKLRPVLILHDPPAAAGIHEVTGLRLVRIETRTPHEQERIRRQEDPALVFLAPRPNVRAAKEYAVSLASLVRLNTSAVVAAEPTRRLDPNEFRTISERLVRSLGLDIGALVDARARELLDSVRGA